MVDKKLFFLTATLIIIGVLFSYSLSVYTVLVYDYSKMHFFLRSFIIGSFSISIMWFISRFDPRKFIHPFGFSLFIIFFFLMFFMHFLPSSLVTEAGGAKRWIRLPFFSLSPVEFFKIGFVFFLAWSFSRKIHDANLTLKEEGIRFLPYLLIFVVIVFLISIMQNDLGQVVLLGSTLGVMAIFAGGSFRFFLILMLSALFMVIILIFNAEYRVDRILQWWANAQTFILSFFPDFIADRLRVANTSEPYQIGHSLNAIHNGGFFGQFFGNGDFKYGFLTEIHTDFILAGIAEELGFVGVFSICMILLLILHRILKIANRVEDRVHYLFCVGVSLLIALSFIINAFGISGLIPIKGIAVPFLSYGGSSILALSVAMGMILSISKLAHKPI